MLKEKVPVFRPALNAFASLKVVPRARRPVSVAFRSGGELSEAVRVIGENRSVLVEAAPCAGKTTVFPYALAAATQSLVVHVFPDERLSYHVTQYLKRGGRGDVKVLYKPSDPYPVDGVVCVSAAVVVAKWLEAGEVSMPDCIVYHDESHVSDAYTYMVKMWCPVAAGVRSYVAATATQGAAAFRPLEQAGRVEIAPYVGAISSWDPYDVGKPWSVSSMRDNALLYVDSRSVAASLVDTYASAGFAAHRLHSRMSLDAFALAEAAMLDSSGPVAVMVADSSYRYGFTFPAPVVLDSGKVGYLDTHTGRPVRRERHVYELEKYQTMARAGRVFGSSARYWFPDGQAADSCICDLEQVEAEAVALMLRVLGYQPPSEFSKCRMYSGKVPRDLCAALRGDQPLALMQEQQLVEMSVSAVPDGRRSPFLADEVDDFGAEPLDAVDPRVSADTAREAGHQRYRVSDRVAAEPAWQADLTALLSVGAGVADMQLGKSYYAVGLVTDSDASVMVYPDGADSVLRMADEIDGCGTLAGLDVWHRSVAVNLLLSRQAALAAEMDGIQRVVSAARSSGKVVNTPPARALVGKIAERLAKATSQLSRVNEVLLRLGRGFCAYHEMEINHALSVSIFDSWMAAWQALPDVDNRARLTAGFSVGREGYRAVQGLVSHTRPQVADRHYVPMPSVGKGMRTITARSGSTSSGSASTDDRCVGSTYWQASVGYEAGHLVQTRKLVCEICGAGASKRTHVTPSGFRSGWG